MPKAQSKMDNPDNTGHTKRRKSKHKQNKNTTQYVLDATQTIKQTQTT